MFYIAGKPTLLRPGTEVYVRYNVFSIKFCLRSPTFVVSSWSSSLHSLGGSTASCVFQLDTNSFVLNTNMVIVDNQQVFKFRLSEDVYLGVR